MFRFVLVKRNKEAFERKGFLWKLNGGEGGIRTPDGLAPMPHFECGAFDHSATSPRSWSAVAGAAH
jgi:hypothetical protein